MKTKFQLTETDPHLDDHSIKANESWISSCITDQKTYQLPYVSERKRHLGTNFKEFQQILQNILTFNKESYSMKLGKQFERRLK